MRVRKTKPGQKRPWEADLGKINGHRVRKFFETRDQAEGFIAAKERERTNHGTEALGITEAERAEYRAAKAKLPDNVSLLEAVEYFNANRRTLKQATFNEAAAQCLADKAQSGRSGVYVQQLKYRLESFGANRGHRQLASIRAEEVWEWLNSNGWAIVTRKGYLTDLRTFFAWAMRNSYVASNPAMAVERPTPEPTPPRHLTLEQLRALLRAGLATDPQVTGGYIAAILFGGPRVCEAKRLTTDTISADGIRLEGNKVKTRNRRIIEDRPQLRAWLKLCPEWPIVNLKRRFHRVRDAAAKLLGVAKMPWPKNCLRHSFCSYALPVMGARATAEAAGHSERILFNTYRALVTKADALAWSNLTPAALSHPKKKRPAHGGRSERQSSVRD